MESIQLIRERLEARRERFEHAELEQILESGLSDALAALSEKVGYEAATFYVFSKRRQKLKKIVDFNGGANFIDRVRFDHGYGLSAWVAKKQRPVYLPDIHRGSRHGYRPIRSYLSMPIFIEDELAAVVNFSHIEPHAFERPQMMLIRKFVDSLKPILQLYHRYQSQIEYETQDSDRRR